MDWPKRRRRGSCRFNGKDLTGWERKPDGWWVEDGAITSQRTKEIPCGKHRYLYWKDGTRTEEEFVSGEKLQEQIKADDWNDYEIIAKGRRIVLKINGQLMCQVDDRDATLACKKGIIALQMHPGPPMKVQFRNMWIRILD